MSQIAIIITLVLVALTAICLFAIFERLRNQRLVDNGAFKGEFLLKSGKSKAIICKTGRETPKGVEILVPVPGRPSMPTYYTDSDATFGDRYPGGKGLWNRITSVEIPKTTWYAGDPRPAIYHQSDEDRSKSLKIISEVTGYLRDETASATAMQASVRNTKLEEVVKNQLKPNHFWMVALAILMTNVVALYFTIQLQGDLNSMDNSLNNTMNAIKQLLGA